MTEAKLRSLQPPHVSAYLTYALCDVRQYKRKSAVFKLIGQDGTTGSVMDVIVQFLSEKFQQGLEYIQGLDAAWLASFKQLPDLQTLLGIAYDLYNAASDVTLSAVKEALSRFTAVATEAFTLLDSATGSLAQAIAQLAFDVADLLVEKATAFVSALKPLFEWTMRLATAAMEKFTQLVNSMGLLTARVMDSLVLAGASEAATHTMFLVFAAALELPKLASVGRDEARRFLQDVSLNVTSQLPSFIPYVWNAAQWVINIPWVSRLAYYLGVTIARVAELMEKVVLFLGNILKKMAHLALAFFAELFGELGYRILQTVKALIEPILALFSQDLSTLGLAGLSTNKLQVPVEGAKELLESAKQGKIKLSDESVTRLNDSIDVIQTFVKDLEESQRQRYVALLKDPRGLYQKIWTKAQYLNRLHEARVAAATTEGAADAGGAGDLSSADGDAMLQDEYGMTMAEFSQRYDNLETQIDCAITLALWEVEASGPTTAGGPPPTQVFSEGLRRRAQRQPQDIQGNLMPMGNDVKLDIPKLRVEIAAYTRLIAEEDGSEARVEFDEVFDRLGTTAQYNFGIRVRNAVDYIRAVAQRDHGGGRKAYYVMQRQRLQDQLDGRKRSINAYGAMAVAGIALGSLVYYWYQANEKAKLDATIRAREKDAAFQQWTHQDPFAVHMHERWRLSAEEHRKTEMDPASRGEDRIESFRQFMVNERIKLGALSRRLQDSTTAIAPDDPAMKEVEQLKDSILRSVRKDAMIVVESKKKQNTPGAYVVAGFKWLTGVDLDKDSWVQQAKFRMSTIQKLEAQKTQDAREAVAQFSSLENVQIPSSYNLLASSLDWTKIQIGQEAYAADLKRDMGTALLSPPPASAVSVPSTSPSAPGIFGVAVQAANFLGLWKQNGHANDRQDDAREANLPARSYVTDIQRLMAWRVDTMHTSLDLYREEVLEDPGIVSKVAQTVVNEVGGAVNGLVDVAGLSNINAGEFFDVMGGGTVRTFNKAWQSINPMNFVKLISFVRFMGVSIGAVLWIVGGLLYIIMASVVAALMGEFEYAWRIFVHRIGIWYPWVGKLLASAIVEHYAYFQAKFFIVGVLLTVAQLVLAWKLEVARGTKKVVGGIWGGTAYVVGGIAGIPGGLYGLYAKSKEENLKAAPPTFRLPPGLAASRTSRATDIISRTNPFAPPKPKNE